MRNLSGPMLLLLLTLSAYAQGPPPPARACKLPVHDQLSGCVLCGLYQISGWCACKILEPCTDGPGADEMEFSGSCVVPQYCGNSVTQSKAIAVKNQAKYAYWLKSTNLPVMLEADYPVVKHALEATRKALLKPDVEDCSWTASTVALRNKEKPSDFIYGELKDMGNGYKLDVRFESDKQPRWTLHIFPNGWSLESGDRVNLLSGSY